MLLFDSFLPVIQFVDFFNNPIVLPLLCIHIKVILYFHVNFMINNRIKHPLAITFSYRKFIFVDLFELFYRYIKYYCCPVEK